MADIKGDTSRRRPVTVRSFLQSEGEMAGHFSRFDWAAHPLGRLQEWPQSLKTAVSLILNSRHPMWIGWGSQMSFLYNDAYLHVLGIQKHPWALGRPASEVWSEIWDVCGPLAEKVFRDGEASFVDEVRLLMSRGDSLEETFYSFSYSPIRDEFGEVAGLFCPSNDVTSKAVGARRSRTLSELVANALIQKSTAAACASAAATLAKNADDAPFAFLYLVEGDRAALEQAVGLPAADEILSPRSIALEGDAPRGVAAAIARVVRGGRAEALSLREVGELPQSPDGRPVVDAIVLPMASRVEMRPLGALFAAVNPTRPFDAEYRAFYELVASNIGTAIHNASAAEEEKKRIDLLAEMDRTKTAFFSNVSHEFRTPLTLMLGPLAQLSRTEDERARALAATARRNALRLLKLVNTLLEFSRLEAGRNDASFAATDLATLTCDVASSFRSAIESAGLSFVVEAELDEPVFADSSMWERILLNLLSNALKFTFEGRISVTLRRAGDAAELRVSDTGVGIAPGELPHLFERFHRVRGATSRTHEGTGIGLALVRDLAELHGGAVEVESVVGVGTTFRVRIPLGSGHLDAAKIVPGATAFPSAIEQYLADVEATVTSAGIAGAAPVSTGARERILLADDNADLREYVSGILSGRYDVTAVKNGREALAAVRNGPFNLIVSDVMMPEMDGFELLQAVRADESSAATPFVLLSARAGEEAAVEGLLEGADDYIVKPFSAEELLARVYAQINAAAIRERATSDLRASEERFRTLAASLPYIVFEADGGGAVLFLSDEFTAYTGSAPESGYGSGWMQFIHPGDAGVAERKWAAALDSGEPFSDEFRLRRRDGADRSFAARALPQRGSDGTIARWIGTITDVHDQRHAAREREFLSRASDIFARPLDLAATLSAIAWFTVPELADWCQIDLRTDDGRVKTVAMAHRAPDKDRIAQQFVGRIHLNPLAEHGSPFVIRTGTSELLEIVPPEIIDPTVGDAEESRMYLELGVGSHVAVPLCAEGVTFGMLAVVYGPSSRRSSRDDVPMLEELGRRAGLAIHKARLFEREHRAAASFQEASLPASLPDAPGLLLDAFYAPGRAEAQVGGDWYDAVRLTDGRVVVSIGDVAGSGLQAAVTMGNMRQIIRGIAQVHADPALMLDAADRALRLEHPDKFVTAFVGVFDPISNLLTYASAGQPPPFLRRPDGETEPLSGTGLPLGLRSNAEKTSSTTIAIPPGSSLLLYTDGLTEFDRSPLDGETRLRQLLSSISPDAIDRPARTIVERMMNGDPPHDDVAVMVVHIGGTPLERSARDGGPLQRWLVHTDDMLAVGAARRGFTEAFREHGATSEDVAAAEIVFGELLGNAVRYAPGPVDVIADWSGPDHVLHVIDRGPGFRHIAILPPDLLSESGRGLFMISALTQDFRIAKVAAGGSHARAVLRMRSRQLVDIRADAISTSPLSAFGELVAVIAD